ncbi:MAG: hypothetical protein LBK74_06500 [Treponema sp.]|jgi:vacuolar-type H+-ATPase subunit I/STV1|nr:hypothetical protein [Treponema sp.]
MDPAIVQNVLNSLNMMWKGMAGLFVVCGVMAILTALMVKWFWPNR